MEMEHFTEKEKKALKGIAAHADSPTYVLANIFNEWFVGGKVSINLETGELAFPEKSNVEDILSAQKQIIELALLIKYLEDKKYIYIIKDGTTTNSLKRIGQQIKDAFISLPLPPDIVNIIKRTLYRVYVSQGLIELVQNNFSTYEMLQMQVSLEQLKTSIKALEEAQKHTNLSGEILGEAKKQSDNLRLQAEESHNQSKDIKEQLELSKRQTEYAKSSLDQATKQTNKANDSLKEAQSQSKLSKWSIGLALLSVIISVVLPILLSRCSTQNVKFEWNPMTNYLDSTIVSNTKDVIKREDSLLYKMDELKKTCSQKPKIKTPNNNN